MNYVSIKDESVRTVLHLILKYRFNLAKER